MRHDLAPAHIASPDSKQFTDAFTAISVRGNGMTTAQVDLAQTSYRSIEELAREDLAREDLVREDLVREDLGPKVGELFYARLFELDPSLRSLFHADIPEQSRKLTQMITAAVHGWRPCGRAQVSTIKAQKSPGRCRGFSAADLAEINTWRRPGRPS
jgi:hypothetical protein